MEANGPVLCYGLQILIVGIVAAELGESEVATWVSWVLFVVGILLLLVHLWENGLRPQPEQESIGANPRAHLNITREETHHETEMHRAESIVLVGDRGLRPERISL